LEGCEGACDLRILLASFDVQGNSSLSLEQGELEVICKKKELAG
jgi:hypothetical protein